MSPRLLLACALLVACTDKERLRREKQEREHAEGVRRWSEAQEAKDKAAAEGDPGPLPDGSTLANAGSAIVGSLKDPTSARLRWREPERVTYHGRSGTAYPAWLVIADVNAKNSYGAYVGERAWRCYFYNGNVLAIVAPGE